MEITQRALWTILHGMGFGALYLMAFSGALVLVMRPSASADLSTGEEKLLKVYLVALAAFAWLTVLSGTYIVYPWYRAVPPPGTIDLAGFPQRLLLSRPSTAGWHSIGMEWKEHVAWLVPLAATMAAAVSLRYGRKLKDHLELRNAVVGFLLISFLAAGIAGFFGAMLDKNAPVSGGNVVHIAPRE
jgi:hypothetical protein